MTMKRHESSNTRPTLVEDEIENQPENEDPTTTTATSTESDIENSGLQTTDRHTEGTPRIHNTGRISSHIQEADSGEEANYGPSGRDQNLDSEPDKH